MQNYTLEHSALHIASYHNYNNNNNKLIKNIEIMQHNTNEEMNEIVHDHDHSFPESCAHA